MSNQDCETPHEFISAVEDRFGMIKWDLAAKEATNKAQDWDHYFDVEMNSLAQDWDACGAMGRTWLNPPFKRIAPWLEKASRCRVTAGPLVIIPASVCTDYFNRFVRSRAMVYELMPRVFGDEVRDVILLDYREVPTLLPGGGYERRAWRWK